MSARCTYTSSPFVVHALYILDAAAHKTPQIRPRLLVQRLVLGATSQPLPNIACGRHDADRRHAHEHHRHQPPNGGCGVAPRAGRPTAVSTRTGSRRPRRGSAAGHGGTAARYRHCDLRWTCARSRNVRRPERCYRKISRGSRVMPGGRHAVASSAVRGRFVPCDSRLLN